jgi:antitoxin MazE
MKKQGSGASGSTPASAMAAAKLRLDQPIQPDAPDLANLIVGITEENRHDEIEFGPPVGREAP